MSSVRAQINIAVAPRAVWRALTTEEGLTSWLVDAARVDGRQGGRVVLTSEGDDGEPVEERGIFHEFRPTRKIEIAWDNTSPSATRGTRVLFQIARDGPDETRVSLVHSGGGVLDDEETRAGIEKTWKASLKSLRSSLEE